MDVYSEEFAAKGNGRKGEREGTRWQLLKLGQGLLNLNTPPRDILCVLQEKS